MQVQGNIRPIVTGREQFYVDALSGGPAEAVSRIYAANGVMSKTTLVASGCVVNRYRIDDGYDLSTLFDNDEIRVKMRRDFEGVVKFAPLGEYDPVFSQLFQGAFSWSDGVEPEDVARIGARFTTASGADADGSLFAALQSVLDTSAGEIGAHVVDFLTAGNDIILYCECAEGSDGAAVIDRLVAPIRDRLAPTPGDAPGKPTVLTEGCRWVATAEQRALAR